MLQHNDSPLRQVVKAFGVAFATLMCAVILITAALGILALATSVLLSVTGNNP